MRILHICNGFFGSKVHANLFRELDAFGITQTVYATTLNHRRIGNNEFKGNKIVFVHGLIVKKIYRAIYHLRIRKVYHDLQKKINANQYDLVHASTLFTDGAIAYKIHQDYGTPYILAVRSTDTNDFLRKLPHTWLRGRNILLNAERIIFITPALMNKFKQHPMIKTILPQIENKFMVLPNGIDEYWINNVNRDYVRKERQVVYCGTMIRRKHVADLCGAILLLHGEFPDVTLHIIGDSGDEEPVVHKLADDNPRTIIWHGRIADIDRIRQLYCQSSIFAMPSVNETFGLVYFEALSQNLALLYMANDGVDGMLPSTVGVAVQKPTKENIADGLRMLFDKRDSFNNKEVNFKTYSWQAIASHYSNIYKEVIMSQTNK